MRLNTIHFQSLALSFLLYGLLPSSTSAQSYNTTLGLRFGDGIGVTARQRILKRTSMEGLFYQHHKSDQTVAGVLVDHHMPVLSRRLNLYAGGGFGWIFMDANEGNAVSNQAIMVNAGLELTIGRINLSWDFIPVMPIIHKADGLTTLTAFSLRYVVIKKSKNKKKGLFNGNKKKSSHKSRHRRKK